VRHTVVRIRRILVVRGDFREEFHHSGFAQREQHVPTGIVLEAEALRQQKILIEILRYVRAGSEWAQYETVYMVVCMGLASMFARSKFVSERMPVDVEQLSTEEFVKLEGAIGKTGIFAMTCAPLAFCITLREEDRR